MSDLDALRAEADRLGIFLDDADLKRVATLLEQTRASVQALGDLPTEWLEPGYVFTPTPAAPRGTDRGR